MKVSNETMYLIFNLLTLLNLLRRVNKNKMSRAGVELQNLLRLQSYVHPNQPLEPLTMLFILAL